MTTNSLAMALDEIIQNQRKSKPAGVVRRRGGGVRRDAVPNTSVRSRFPQRGFTSGVALSIFNIDILKNALRKCRLAVGNTTNSSNLMVVQEKGVVALDHAVLEGFQKLLANLQEELEFVLHVKQLAADVNPKW